MQDLATPLALLVAIDLRGGRVVRLKQGDFARETAYADDPVAVATSFVDGGAAWLHVVDLDAARQGRGAHAAVIVSIIEAVGTRAAVEVAGGLRAVADVERVLRTGAARAVVGTAAITDPGFAAELVAAHGPDRIAVAVDVRDGMAVGSAWVGGVAGRPLADVLDGLDASGVEWLEVTAIDRDGTLGGPDVELLRQVVDRRRFRVIAAGGIASVGDIRVARDVGCAGVIVGRALYDGTLGLAVATEAAGTG
ncbi:MAG TPA: 1-(5-phosphoribosyl)-5-[(5-phosphoribosylamino)methylideneamino] imidazole-4-carboxamide isomerase [Candidatus Dormibacteraeota bacterium]|nr:1-(5-phosphoribosyl)-5-[(5-phosphoribosylamino)methylideneamino] imidazole-4-carboxamide isomerase [Candidatus Dormibacteraeota bacterium]